MTPKKCVLKTFEGPGKAFKAWLNQHSFQDKSISKTYVKTILKYLAVNQSTYGNNLIGIIYKHNNIFKNQWKLRKNLRKISNEKKNLKKLYLLLPLPFIRAIFQNVR